MRFEYNDGGRELAGFKGKTGDCVTRALSITLGRPYKEVYNEIFKFIGYSPRNGVEKKDVKKIFKHYGFDWTPTMFVGQGCKVHLKKDELPTGAIICNVSKHMVAVKDGVVYDTYDCTRGATRCVYGYWKKSS